MSGKESLYKAFHALMKEKPFPLISISEIVKKANINRNTFYYHFKDIFGFVKAFLEDEITNALKEKMKRNQFNEAFLIWLDYCENHLELMKNLLDHSETRMILEEILVSL